MTKRLFLVIATMIGLLARGAAADLRGAYSELPAPFGDLASTSHAEGSVCCGGGMEADFNGSSIVGDAVLGRPGVYARLTDRTDYFRVVHGRVDYAFNRVMFYAAGDLASVDPAKRRPSGSVASALAGLARTDGGVQVADTRNAPVRVGHLHLAFHDATELGNALTDPREWLAGDITGGRFAR